MLTRGRLTVLWDSTLLTRAKILIGKLTREAGRGIIWVEVGLTWGKRALLRGLERLLLLILVGVRILLLWLAVVRSVLGIAKVSGSIGSGIGCTWALDLIA